MELLIVERGCGDPVAGGFYGHIGMGPGGVPPKNFLIDYPMPIPDEVEIKPRGLTLIEHEGITHVVDWIGENNYPNFPDWWEELCRFGFHQRVETNLPFERLDPERSKYIMVHKRGLVTPAKAAKLLDEAQHYGEMHYEACPTDKHEVDWRLESDVYGMCVGLLWQALVKPTIRNANGIDGLVLREMPSFSYYGFETKRKLDFQPAYLAMFPISMMRWLIYRGADGEEFDTREKLEDAPDWVQDNIAYVEAKNE